RKADVRARLATVVMGVDEVDTEALQAFHGFARALVRRRAGADLGVVQRDGREVDARAIEEEIPAIDPELAEPEAHGIASIHHISVHLDKRDLCGQHVLWRVDVPEFLGFPFLGDGEAAALEVAALEGLARERTNGAAVLPQLDTQGVLAIRGEPFDGGLY